MHHPVTGVVDVFSVRGLRDLRVGQEGIEDVVECRLVVGHLTEFAGVFVGTPDVFEMGWWIVDVGDLGTRQFTQLLISILAFFEVEGGFETRASCVDAEDEE